MRRLVFSCDGVFLVVLFLLLAGFTAFVTLRQREIQAQQDISVAYSSQSAQPDGTLALFEWLDRLGYPTNRIQDREFEIDPATRVFCFCSRRQ